jgi:hypothetical protein
MWILRLIQGAFSFALTIGIAGGLVDLAIAMRSKSQAAAQGGLVSLKSLNEQLQSGKSHRELHGGNK